MKTPIADFVRDYAAKDTVRFHMPGHKGKAFLGCEAFDITEIKGADELYAPCGIIAESEKNASLLFGTARTVYSTEGSSQCIRAMIHMAATMSKSKGRGYILAARNVHKAFIYALALEDIDVKWLIRKTDSLCSCKITADDVKAALENAEYPPVAVYVTSPDYLGNRLDIKGIADACHKAGTVLIVDNAHGAYLKFLHEGLHPMELGADMCCDSAHKTLPVLTGGAYLHISPSAPEYFSEGAKGAMALFGSTSPSYLTLASLDGCNAYLSDNFSEKLKAKAEKVKNTKCLLSENGWSVSGDEPMKITLLCPKENDGFSVSEKLYASGFECEYADAGYVVMMISAETEDKSLDALVRALGKNTYAPAEPFRFEIPMSDAVMTVREAVFSRSESVPLSLAEGRICAAPAVSCPPAIPIAVSGEVIGKEHIALFRHYGISAVSVVKK